ncbi:MAG: hypothetical protein IKM51_05870 [Oscillospiraceae bacterium]|nr:hypothetical protein [Oscillospiraceae bacterium]
MKKVLIFILALTMLLSMAACGKTESKDDAANNDSAADSTPTAKPEDNAPTEKPEDDAPAADDETGEETPDEPSEPDIDVDVDVDGPAADPNDTPAEPDMPAVEPDEPAVEPDEPAVDEPATDVPAGETLGTILNNDFISRAEADSSLSAEEMANAIISNPVIQFGPATMPVEPGFLMGFDNAEITGFSQGVMFAPMIGSIPFVGYVFILEDGADVQAFLDTLNANANPRWNICVEAEETVSANVGNMVFFVMCPTSVEG